MSEQTEYLYEYKDGKRVRNVGFMKITPGFDSCDTRIYAKEMDRVMGIVFQRENGEVYIASWEDFPMRTERRGVTTAEEWLEKVATRDTGDMEEVSVAVKKSVEANIQSGEVAMQGAESIRSATESIVSGGKKVMPVAEGVTPVPEEITEYIIPKELRCEKIQRQDLSRLPRKEWRIANNSFLLHGFYNYHHLLYMEDGGRVYIGVPGIYHEKEKMAAVNFGFPEFRRESEVQLDLSSEERNTYEDFGYWCRQVSGQRV